MGSRRTVHVLIPFTTKVACDAPHHSATGMYRESITCRLCRQSDHFKRLEAMPRKYRKVRKNG